MLKIVLADKSEYEVLQNSTAIYPSYSNNQRNRMELHMRNDLMSLSQLEAIFTDKTKTDSIVLVDDRPDDIPPVHNETVYNKYNYVASLGKETVVATAISDVSSPPVSEIHIVVKLEQLTYIEQQLESLGITE